MLRPGVIFRAPISNTSALSTNICVLCKPIFFSTISVIVCLMKGQAPGKLCIKRS